MKSNIQHQADKHINQELKELRNPINSTNSLGESIRAMQTAPTPKRWHRRLATVGVGSATLLVGAIAVAGSLAPSNAFAGELGKITSAQASQKKMHQKSFLYNGAQKPNLIMEFWFDHNKNAYRQYSGDNKLQIARTHDGAYQYHYVTAEMLGSNKPYAVMTKEQSSGSGVTTVDAMLDSPYYRQWKIEKQEGVRLLGKVCDLYKFANGTYKLWVDQATRLPLQQEIYGKNKTLWKRDSFEYPSSFSESTFKPFMKNEVKYVEKKAVQHNPQEPAQKTSNGKSN